MEYIDQLIKNCQVAKNATPVREFQMGDISALDGIQQAIYIIEELGGNPEESFENLRAHKEERKDIKFPKLNKPSKVMYVGSSTTGLRKRIEQHIGNDHTATYALHLEYWFKGAYKITVRQYDVSREVLQIIEDAISYELKPAFGKQGGNNK